jgi:hypothetical protein
MAHVDAKVKAESAAAARLDELVDLALQVKQRVSETGVALDDDAGRDTLYTELRKEFKDFAHSFPLPFRWLIQTGEFDTAAFKAHVKHDYKVVHKTRGDFLESQGEYLMRLYKQKHPRAGEKELRARRESIYKMLKDEDEDFQEAKKEADEEVKRVDREIAQRRREQLAALLKHRQASAEPAA